MKTLAIDTSNYPLSIALLDGEQLVAVRTTTVKVNHSIRVMPAIEELMSECNWQPKQLERIVVAEGPGSYTGVRIGVTIAKTLAWTLNIPLVGVSSLKALARNVEFFDGLIVPLFDARRGQAYMAVYRLQHGELVEVMSDTIMLVERYAEQVAEQGPIMFVGDVAPYEALLREKLGERFMSAPKLWHEPNAAVLGYLGQQLEPVDVHSFVPNYVRLAEAEAKLLNKHQD